MSDCPPGCNVHKYNIVFTQLEREHVQEHSSFYANVHFSEEQAFVSLKLWLDSVKEAVNHSHIK